MGVYRHPSYYTCYTCGGHLKTSAVQCDWLTNAGRITFKEHRSQRVKPAVMSLYFVLLIYAKLSAIIFVLEWHFEKRYSITHVDAHVLNCTLLWFCAIGVYPVKVRGSEPS